MQDTILAVGLMSGTSLDGIDAAILRTDGEARLHAGAHLTLAYEDDLRTRLRGILGGVGEIAEVERDLTFAHADLVRRLLEHAGVTAPEVGLLGFHGHTIWHRPKEGRTWQIGDGALLAELTGIDVISDFRSADVAAGGEGAPFAPVFHAAIASAEARPLLVLNLGGVANVTWIGADGELTAFDTGPGNALIDDWAARHTGQRCDLHGDMATRGRVQEDIVEAFLADPFFRRPAPKSLDRLDFDLGPVARLSADDGAATLTACTAAAVAVAFDQFRENPKRCLVTGGGRHNPALMRALRERLPCSVDRIDRIGWDGDALEAQLFAYLAVRSHRGLPLSFPGTTGVSAPQTGGTFHPAPPR